MKKKQQKKRKEIKSKEPRLIHTNMIGQEYDYTDLKKELNKFATNLIGSYCDARPDDIYVYDAINGLLSLMAGHLPSNIIIDSCRLYSIMDYGTSRFSLEDIVKQLELQKNSIEDKLKYISEKRPQLKTIIPEQKRHWWSP